MPHHEANSLEFYPDVLTMMFYPGKLRHATQTKHRLGAIMHRI
jgi:hypothetical protein